MVKRVDAVLTVALFATVCLIGATFHPPDWRSFDWLAYLLSAGACLPLAVRRTHPVAMLLTTTGFFVLYLFSGYQPTFNWWGPVLAFYTVAALRPAGETALCAVLAGATTVYSGLLVPGFPVAVAWAQGAVVPAAAWMLGDVSRQLAAVTAQLRQEQDRHTARALTEERLRIARELHDVVAHHLAVISMQSGLADYVFDTDPPTARAAVGTIGTTSRATLEEMRRLLHLLRTSEAPDEPAPALSGLPSLADRVRQTGVPVSLEVGGDTSALPSGLQVAVYRVVQEALTNVIKHAPGASAEVALTCSPDRLSAIVANSPPVHPTRSTGNGHGLIGMSERARIYGGALVAGPRADGGFVVELTVPLP
ncbi:sensor histidine kinase [Lentzea tibetensis]|uniref:histidine kinase n=1 Tax=Lentzea tibetensis TaxID=2591470 RepID=A0A563EPA1_9PSEU|nr:sensor histidine kinase [Lentzea tibetensis]TWP49132.1 sensor histidine kinase [Lentzea tibetensis]